MYLRRIWASHLIYRPNAFRSHNYYLVSMHLMDLFFLLHPNWPILFRVCLKPHRCKQSCAAGFMPFIFYPRTGQWINANSSENGSAACFCLLTAFWLRRSATVYNLAFITPTGYCRRPIPSWNWAPLSVSAILLPLACSSSSRWLWLSLPLQLLLTSTLMVDMTRPLPVIALASWCSRDGGVSSLV